MNEWVRVQLVGVLQQGTAQLKEVACGYHGNRFHCLRAAGCVRRQQRHCCFARIAAGDNRSIGMVAAEAGCHKVHLLLQRYPDTRGFGLFAAG